MAFLAPLAIAAGASASTAATIASVGSAVGTIASIAGAGVGALGAIKQGQAEKSSAEYNAQIAANNAKLATQNAGFAAKEGEAQAEASSLKTRAQVGGIVANQGAAGVDVNTGSAVDVRSSAAQLGELSALDIRSNAARQAYGYQTESTGSTAQSQLDKMQGANAGPAGSINAGATLLGGLGSASTNYTGFLNKNGFGASSDITAQAPTG